MIRNVHLAPSLSSSCHVFIIQTISKSVSGASFYPLSVGVYELLYIN